MSLTLHLRDTAGGTFRTVREGHCRGWIYLLYCDDEFATVVRRIKKEYAALSPRFDRKMTPELTALMMKYMPREDVVKMLRDQIDHFATRLDAAREQLSTLLASDADPSTPEDAEGQPEDAEGQPVVDERAERLRNRLSGRTAAAGAARKAAAEAASKAAAEARARKAAAEAARKAAAEAEDDTGLSEYELQRKARMRRNEAMVQTLGMGPVSDILPNFETGL
eukprot:SAG31_NODE_8675_length_1408_cov_2.385791_2_plen_223_part_00